MPEFRVWAYYDVSPIDIEAETPGQALALVLADTPPTYARAKGFYDGWGDWVPVAGPARRIPLAEIYVCKLSGKPYYRNGRECRRCSKEFRGLI